MSLLVELRRRNVMRVGAAYVVVSWLVIQVAETILPLFGYDETPARTIVIVLMIGFVPALVFAWIFEFTPEGLKRESTLEGDDATRRSAGKQLDRVILVVLAIAVCYFAFDKFLLDPARDQSDFETARQQGRSDALVESYGDLSIAVLPFLDLSPDKSQEYMSDGLAEEMLNLLAKTPELRVISRSSAFFFKNKEIDLPTVANQLNVNYVVEGSVRTFGDQLRVTAQLIEARSDTQLWSGTYDHTLENIFEIQDEISRSIAESLRVELIRGASGNEQPIVNAEAHRHYLLGKERLELRTREDIEAAISEFEQAIELDAEFAPAHVQLAHGTILLDQYVYGGSGNVSAESHAIVDRHLQRALALDPTLPEAYGVLGYLHLELYQIDAALSALNQAISLNPNFAMAYNFRAEVWQLRGQYLDMLADSEKAYALDPMSIQISVALAEHYREFWRPKDADRIIRRLFERHPGHALVYRAAILNLGFHGRHAEAEVLTREAAERHPDTFGSSLPIGYYMMGMFDEVRSFNNDIWNFRISLVEGDYENAKLLLDKTSAKKSYGGVMRARQYYRVAAPADQAEQLSALVEETIAWKEARGSDWRDQCDLDLIYDLTLLAIRKDDAEHMMAQCQAKYEQRLQAGYICPCKIPELVHYMILDGRYDDAIKRMDQWLATGDTDIEFAIDPFFNLLADRPEYADLLERNKSQYLRQQQIYLAMAAAEQ